MQYLNPPLFPSIEQFHTIIHNVNTYCEFNNISVKPIINFHGTIKLHGSNAGVLFSKLADGSKKLLPLSRTQFISVENDNVGFAKFVHKNTEHFNKIHEFLSSFINLQEIEEIVIYGEWLGKGIQKGTGINNVSKRFMVFGIMICDEEGLAPKWLSNYQLKQFGVFLQSYRHTDLIDCIENYNTYDIVIDFNDVVSSRNKLVELTTSVENDCPVSRQLGFPNCVGEGIVWSISNQLDYKKFLRFKVKGEKHSDTKVKTMAPVDLEKIKSVNLLAEGLVTDYRFEKAIDYVISQLKADEKISIKNIGEFLKWISLDIIKEDTDIINHSQLESKDVIKAVSNLAKTWFFKKYPST